MTLAAVAALCVRSLFVILFMPFSALDTVLSHKGAVAHARQMFPRAVSVTLIALAEVFGSGVGTDGSGLDGFLHDPLASSRPYPWSAP